MPSPIEDYAVIGNCETVALVGRDGSIDWLGLPRFDSAACFSALLGEPEHGRWLIAPSEPAQVTRRYRDATLILETTFRTEQGAVWRRVGRRRSIAAAPRSHVRTVPERGARTEARRSG